MRILHICPTVQIDSPLAPESLQYLGHQVERLSLERLCSSNTESMTVDVVVADACIDLSLAPTIAEVAAESGIAAPIIVVLSEGGLATASAKWNVIDVVLTTAGPAEVEARLRLARDRHRANGSNATASAAHGTSPTSRTDGAARDSGGSRSEGGPWGGGGPRTSEGDPLIVVSGALRIDETAFTAHLGERSLDLTYREFALLKFFAMHPERVFTRDEILLDVWGDDYYGGTRTVDVHVRRVRAKLGKDLENAIHTVRNVGYRFSPDSASAHDDGPESDTGDEAEAEGQPKPGIQPEEQPSEEDVKV